nr:MAG TPA: minor tail protein [Caudoviricetes sp.]
MAVRTIGTDIILGGEREFNDQMKSVNNNLKNLKSDMARVSSEFDSNADSIEALTAKQKILSEQYDQQKEKVRALSERLEQQIEVHGESSAAADKYRQQLNYAQVALNKTKKELDAVTEAQAACSDETGRASKAMEVLQTAGKGVGKGLEVGAKGLAVFGAAAAAGVAALLQIEEETAEYRENQAKLNTAFEAAGMATGTASKAYTELYKILGDSDNATESAQLLAQLATNEQDVAKWADISAGVVGSFGDALPINSLIEASNETAKVGKVTGALADALNWVGLSEDEFNSKLAACSSEQERNQLITSTLTAAYGDASAAFRQNNAEVIAANEAQAQLDETLAKLGGSVSVVKNKLIAEFLPSISEVVDAFVDFMNGTEGAEDALRNAVENMVNNLVEKLPEFLDFGVELIVAIATGIIKNLPYLMKMLPSILDEILESFGKLGPAMLDIGKNVVTGLWEGIKSMSGWLFDKLFGWIGDIQNSFTGKDGFDTHSPSKWSEGVFENVMLGGGIGVDKGAVELRRNTVAALNQLKRDFSSLEGLDTRFDVNARLTGAAVAQTPVYGGKTVNLTIHSTQLSQAEIDYLIMKVNQELGSAV